MSRGGILKLRSIGISDYRVLEGRQSIGRIRFVIERMPGVWLWNVTVHLSKVQSADQRMRVECGVGFRQLRRAVAHVRAAMCQEPSWVYNLRPKTPPWQLGQGRLERLLYLLYGEYAEDGGPRDSHATTHPVCQ